MLAFAKQGNWLKTGIERNRNDFRAFCNEESLCRLKPVAQLCFRKRAVNLKLLAF